MLQNCSLKMSTKMLRSTSLQRKNRKRASWLLWLAALPENFLLVSTRLLARAPEAHLVSTRLLARAPEARLVSKRLLARAPEAQAARVPGPRVQQILTIMIRCVRNRNEALYTYCSHKGHEHIIYQHRGHTEPNKTLMYTAPRSTNNPTNHFQSPSRLLKHLTN